jgi:hypothetical protein
MSKVKKSPTKTIKDRKGNGDSKLVSHRKNTSGSTRNADRQRSGNNDPQPGSH